MLQQEMQQTTTSNQVELHPQAIDFLFCFKRKLSNVFRDVIGLHDIDSISLYVIDRNNQLIALSHTPSIEYNLFNSNLWRYDNTFANNFHQTPQWSWWQALYQEERFDDLHYIKQIKYQFKQGMAISQHKTITPIIYSFASKTTDIEQQWQQTLDDLSQIGDYCYQQLIPLIESLLIPAQGNGSHEKST